MKKFFALVSTFAFVSGAAVAADPPARVTMSDPDLNGAMIATGPTGSALIIELAPNDTLEAKYAASKKIKGLDCAAVEAEPDETVLTVTVTAKQCDFKFTNATAKPMIVIFAAGSKQAKLTGKFSYKLSNTDT